MSQNSLRVYPQKSPLRGTVSVPGDKSISHRAVMLGAIAQGTSTIRGWLPAGDTLATLAAIEALGISVTREIGSAQAWDLAIPGRGLRGLRAPERPIDCRNAGTGLRLLAGILAGQAFPSVLDGSEQLRKRPMRRIIEPLSRMGAHITANESRAPLAIEPAPLHGIAYRLPVASAQVKSAILLAALYASGETRVHQPGPARDHTERMLAAMGADITVAEPWISLRPAPAGERELSPLALTVPGDISSAAFPIVAAAIVPHSDITLTNVGMNDTRTGILHMLKAMGATYQVDQTRLTGGEPAADIRVRFDEMHSTEVAGATVVRGIDEIPIWSVAATQAAGVSAVRDAAELRVKEVDRISVLATELRRLGARIDEWADGFAVAGSLRLAGSEVDSHDDHRLGMALAVAGLVADGPTVIHNADCIADSFPGFVETMQALGAGMEWLA